MEKQQAIEEDDLPLVFIDRGKLDYCKNKRCPQRKDFGPHKHQAKGCQEHKFCEMSKGCHLTDLDNGLTFPINDKGEDIKTYSKKIMNFREQQKLHQLQKIAVTEYSYDHWFAQSFGLDIDDLPANCPLPSYQRPMYRSLCNKYPNRGSQLNSKKVTLDVQEDPQTKDSKSKVPGQHPTEMDQLKPYIYRKSSKVETIIGKASSKVPQYLEESNGEDSIQQEDPIKKEQRCQCLGCKKIKGNLVWQQSSENQLIRPLTKLELETCQRFKSPFINEFLQRKEVELCTEKIQEKREQVEKKTPKNEVTINKATFVSPTTTTKLTTFQKLQLLRNKKKESVERPLQNLLMQAASKKPKEHFQEKRHNIQIEENVENSLQFINKPQNKHKLDSFLQNYSNEMIAAQYHQVDLENQKRCQEFNKSILSPNISLKKENLVKSLQIWPIKHNISIQKQNALIAQLSSKDTIDQLTEGVSNLEKEVFKVRASKLKKSKTPEQIEKIKTKRLYEQAQRPKIKIINDSVQESAKDGELHKILGRIGCTAQTEAERSIGDIEIEPSRSAFQTQMSPLGELKNNIVTGRYTRPTGASTSLNYHSRSKSLAMTKLHQTATSINFIPEKSEMTSLEASQVTLQQMYSGTVSNPKVQFVHTQQPPINFYKTTLAPEIKKSATMASGVGKKSSTISHQTCGNLIQASDIEMELEEPKQLDQSLQQVNVILELQAPNNLKIDKNVFECPEYWLSKGYQAQTGKIGFMIENDTKKKKKDKNPTQNTRVDKSDQALDFYFQGLRKNFNHYACCFNIGVTYMQKGKNKNAQKWFRFAKQLEPEMKEPVLGEAICCFKLGELKECINILQSRPGMKNKNEKKRKSCVISTTHSSNQSIEHSKTEKSHTDRDHEPSAEHQDSHDNHHHNTHQAINATHDHNCIVAVKLDIENQFSFLQAITYKKARIFDKSQKEYRKLEKTFNQRQGYKLARTAFTNLMLPLQISRKVVEENVQTFLDCVSITDQDAYWDEELYKPLDSILHFKHRTWTNIGRAVLYLREMPLFKRLMAAGVTSPELKDIIPELKVVEKKKGEIIFDDEKNLYIVLNGRVNLRYHEEDPLEYQYIAQYTPGMVIGHDSLDGGMSKLGQVFNIVASCKCVLLKVDKQVFDDKIWRRTKIQKTEIKIRALQQFNLVQELCDQTLYDIMYEKGQIMLFKPGQKVMNCHVRSALNREGRFLYDQEYCNNMRQEANSIQNKQLADTDQITSSPLGNFFAMVNATAKQRAADGLDPYSKIHNVPREKKQGNPPESSIRPLALILDGSCQVVANRDFVVFEMRPGNHFGASDVLRIPDIEYLGDIVAGPKGVKVMVIPKPDQVLQLWERKNLQEKLRNTLDTLKIMVENKYGLGQSTFQLY